MLRKSVLLAVCVGLICVPLCSCNTSTSTIATTSSPNPKTTTNLNTSATLLPTQPSNTDGSCSANNGTCNNITTTAPKSKHSTKHKEKWKSETLQPSYYKFKMSTRSDCECDLHNRFCDINCCCDKDCALEAKQVFTFCIDEMNLPAPNSKYCNYMQYIYNNRTLYEEEVQQNSLFCIAKTNLPAHYYKQRKKVILNPLHANVVIKDSSSYEWANRKNEENNFEDWFASNIDKNGNLSLTNRTALFGDAIFVLKNYSVPHQLELAASFVTPDCITTKSVRYLQDLKTRCRQVLHDHNFHLFVQSFTSNRTALSSLRFLNTTLEHYEGCPKNVCIPFNIKQCDFTTCWNMSNTTVSSCNGSTKMCTNIVTKVKYTFRHNGTEGIQNIDIGLLLSNISLLSMHVDQEQEVKFLWHNQTEFNYSDYRSGQPGYQVGKPILFGKLITVINATTNSTTNKTTSHKTQHIQRNDAQYIANFLVFPKNTHGKCALSSGAHENINFGYNMLTKCVHSQGFIRQANVTANETCWLLQNNILAYWSLDVDPKQFANTTSNATFGYFGNAQNGNLEDWGMFLFDVLPEELLNATHGRDLGSGSSRNIVCQNISTGIKYSVFYERVQNEQQRIAAVYVEFAHGQSVDLRLQVFGRNGGNGSDSSTGVAGNVFSEVQLRSEVMFYDVTGVRNRKFVDPPSLHITLPYDFFYPFIKVEKVENHAFRVAFSFSVWLFVLCISISVFL